MTRTKLWMTRNTGIYFPIIYINVCMQDDIYMSMYQKSQNTYIFLKCIFWNLSPFNSALFKPELN